MHTRLERLDGLGDVGKDLLLRPVGVDASDLKSGVCAESITYCKYVSLKEATSIKATYRNARSVYTKATNGRKDVNFPAIFASKVDKIQHKYASIKRIQPPINRIINILAS